MAEAEKAYQHKGHAKWMDIARLFGWEKLDTYWRSFQEDDANNIPYATGTDDLLLRLSKSCGADIRPLFHFWGIYPQNPSALAASIAAANIPSSNAIRLQLLSYKNIVPANNAAFRTFATSWWGRQPTINGAWEEREHARQWDTTALYGPGDQQRSQATNPGEIYNENSALDIRNRIDELVALYYPGAITPNPMTFATAPVVVNATTVGMVATNATAGTGPVQYYFDETSGNPGGTDSAWQASPVYQDTGLTSGVTYTYKVKARDGSLNETDLSGAFNVTPTASGDITPPSPSPMTFAIAPVTVDQETITMTASAASDINGVEYYFENITNATNSGWQSSPVYTETNLALSTPYTYRVKARDMSAVPNETAFSATATANTGNLPDVIPPVAITFSPAGGSTVTNLATNLVVTFDEPVLKGTGSITLKNLSDATEAVFDINDSAVTISGSSVTLNPPTDLLYEKNYAVQISSGAVADVSNNPFIGISDDTTWAFATVLANPIVSTGGPYVVPTGSSLALNASAIPSTGATVNSASYSWDLNNNNTFGDATGAAPTAITDTVLTSTWGMVTGQNTIKLRVTDSLGNSTTVTTIVKIGANMSWDANGASANQTDGAGTWLNANQWRDNNLNTTWIPGSTAVFGNSGTGGNVTLGANTTARSLTFNAFSGTYTISGGGILTVNNGLTNNSTAGAVTITTPLILGGPQTWGGTSTGALIFNGGINNNGNTLTLAVNGNITMNAAANIISGGGGLTMSGAGKLTLGGNPAAAHTYTGTTTINSGTLMISNNLGGGNLTINGGYLETYYGGTISRTLGSGTGQIQILGGSSGFSNNGDIGTTIRLNNSAAYEVVWGSAFFNPSTLLLQSPTDQNGSSVLFDNRIDLNGADRTIFTASTTTGAGSSTLAQIVRNSSTTTPAGLIKTGSGRLNLNAANTFNGGTTVQAGTLQLGNAAALGSSSGSLTVNGGLLNLNDQTVSVGNLTGSGGTIANNASNARTLTIGTGNGSGGIYQGIIANKTGAGTGSVALTKTGNGTITLAGLNTYTGATLINGGGTLVLTGATQATTAITFAANSALGLAIGSPVTASSAAVNLANGRISVTGTPSGASHVLLTALSITGTPVLASAVPGYELAVVGNQLLLNQVVTDPYAIWSGGAAFGADANNDGVLNGIAWVLGAPNPTANANSLLPSIDNTTDPDYFIFTYRRSDSANTAPNTTITVQYDSDLNGWTNAVHDGNNIIITPANDGAGVGIDSVQVKIKRTLAVAGKLFIRLNAAVSP
jgi:autotransporter-associated beta strand protein